MLSVSCEVVKAYAHYNTVLLDFAADKICLMLIYIKLFNSVCELGSKLAAFD